MNSVLILKPGGKKRGSQLFSLHRNCERQNYKILSYKPLFKGKPWTEGREHNVCFKRGVRNERFDSIQTKVNENKSNKTGQKEKY